ncbi:MAG: 23S rRNA (adenine(2503)-C(2))-methyltransferase RlmN [bacterium]|jgi:23S rRNA (adenine2503-C2)-methyltransferase
MTTLTSVHTQSLFEFTSPDLSEWLKEHGQPSFRVGQIFQWVYQKHASSFDDMSNLSKDLRARFKEHFTLETPALVTEQYDQADQTRKILLELSDGERVEAVLMPRFQKRVMTNPQTGEVSGREKFDSYTTCLSTQAGCLFACKFCASGQLGYERNLSAGEIVSQFMTFARQGHRITNIVFMGMGEPLHNLVELRKAVDILCDRNGIGLSPRRITISTVGLVPEIYRMAEESWKTRLAVSLHATTDEKRARLLPVSRAYQIDQLKDALLYYQKQQGRRLSFEYLMIDGFNDSAKDAERMIDICEDLVCHVNLIPFNSVPRSEFKAASPESIRRFQRILLKNGIDTTIRYSRGRNIDAACGQLRMRHEQ